MSLFIQNGFKPTIQYTTDMFVHNGDGKLYFNNHITRGGSFTSNKESYF